MARRRKKKEPKPEEVFTVVDLDEFDTVCHVCKAEFLDGDDLKVHIAQVHSNELINHIVCVICGLTLTGSEEFVSHFIFKHLEQCTFCSYCFRVFSDALLRSQHESKHCALNKTMGCSQCSTLFTNKLELLKHEYEEHENNEGFMLNSYFSLLSSALNMKILNFLHNVCEKKSLTCKQCSNVSANVSDYIKHLQTSKCRSIACDNCFNVFKKKSGIKWHLLKVACNVDTKKVFKRECNKCGEKFDSKHLDAHKKLCSKMKCCTCLKVFESIVDLTEHRNLEHDSKITLHTCKFCRKQFVGLLTLNRHMSNTHRDISRYKYRCVHCDSVFNHPGKLFAHYFRQHRDIEPFTCKICNKCFRLRKHFTIHIKLEHKSIGFVEFDKDFHVIFTDKKSENPVAPQGLNMGSTTKASDSDSQATPAKQTKKSSTKQTECKKSDSTLLIDDLDTNSSATLTSNTTDDTNQVASIKIEIERLDDKNKTNQLELEKYKSLEDVSDSSKEPFSKVKQALLKRKHRTSNIKRRTRNYKKAKLTCNICKKYCYTVQNYHHHMTLHEKSKLKKCIKCNIFFKSKMELQNHMQTSHSSSKLIETLKSVVEKRKILKPAKAIEPFRSVLERRRQELSKNQNFDTNKFRKTIRKVDIVDDCTATLTAITDHGLSVKNFIENFKPEADSVNISNSVTLKVVDTPPSKKPVIKMIAFNPETEWEPPHVNKLRLPEKFKELPSNADGNVSVKLVQQLITKPSAVNMTYNENIPSLEDKLTSEAYCNMFADETDYTQYKNDTIPEVAQEIMLEDLEDIPRTKRLAQEIIIPQISEEHGEVRIGHLLPQAPYYKIVKVKKLIRDKERDAPMPDKQVSLPDGTKLVSVRNPYKHLIPNDHLQEVLEANRNKYYKPRTKNIEKAIAKTLEQGERPQRSSRKKTKNDS